MIILEAKKKLFLKNSDRGIKRDLT
jgi:hypothetical protein